MPDNAADDTLLAHLAWKLSNRHEDIAVEALGYVLRSKPARDVVAALVKQRGAEVGDIVGVRTQVTGEDSARPDLVGFDQHGTECVMMEAKFWAGLTENQPNSYLGRLSEGRALLFIAPASRMETLWSELCQRAGHSNPQLADEMTNLKSVKLAGEKHLMLISWPHLLDRLEASGDVGPNYDISQLRGLVTRIDQEGEFLPLRSDELAPEFARRIVSLWRLVDDATKRSQEAEYVSTQGLLVTAQKRGYGRYVQVAGSVGWFGIGLDWWGRGTYPDTPLWLYFEPPKGAATNSLHQTREALDPLTRMDPPQCIDEPNAILVPIVIPTGVEYDEVLDAVVHQIQRVSELIKATP